ncbi:MAG: ribonuclease P protein component [Gallionella sp.]|nr:ribonuclease P protein component [Gallionella sp.]
MLKAVQDSLYKATYRFTAAKRIPRCEGFKPTLDAKSLANPYFKLFFVPNQKVMARLGMMIGKRYFPHAVDRNKHKRMVRDVFRLHPISQEPLDLVVMARRVEVEDSKIRREALVKLFSQLKTRCG